MERNVTLNYLLIFFALLMPMSALAQSLQGVVKGQVLDQDSQALLEYATISIFSQKDSSIVTGEITDNQGIFTIKVPPGKHFVKIEFIGYQAKTINDIIINRKNRTVDLGIIKMGTDTEVLVEVEVRAEKSSVQMGLDKRIFNVGQDLANDGGSAADVLDNVPSVAVDIDGNVSLRGSQGVQILIDGKPSGLVGIGSTGGLRGLPANLIDKVEVITNPSAKFEAEGTSGIINIILKKEKKKGLNGSFDFMLGYPEMYGTAINLNLRRKKLNFFTNIGVNKRTNIGGGSSFQRFFNENTALTSITEQSRTHTRGGISSNIRLGADYYFSPKDILTTSFLYRIK
ncbi:MAG: carboxypeptidase regulatory-like domain-containing protein, partial [Bacteroidota bacterium]